MHQKVRGNECTYPIRSGGIDDYTIQHPPILTEHNLDRGYREGNPLRRPQRKILLKAGLVLTLAALAANPSKTICMNLGSRLLLFLRSPKLQAVKQCYLE